MGSSNFLSTLKKAATVAGDVLTTKGDILSRSASALGRLGVGSNGQVLQADSTQTLGIKWATASGISLSEVNTWLANQKFNDNIEIQFGTGADSAIYYDGTNMIIDPKKVGSGYLQINGDIWQEGGEYQPNALVKTADYNAIDDNIDWLRFGNVVGSGTDNGVQSGLDGGRMLTTGGTNGNASNFRPLVSNFDCANFICSGIIKRVSADSYVQAGVTESDTQGGDVVMYGDQGSGTYKHLSTREDAVGTLISNTDVGVDTAKTHFFIVANGTSIRLWLIVGGIWTLKATNSNSSYQPTEVGRMNAYLATNTSAAKTMVLYKFTLKEYSF